MDRSVGTIDVHKLKFDNHLDNVSDDSLDDEDDDEKSELLDGLLHKAFDDMSSIGEDEEPPEHDMRHSKHSPSSIHRQHSPLLYSNEANGNLMPSSPPSSSDKDSGTGKSETGLHLRLLLEDNVKVTKMNEELKSRLTQSENHVTQQTNRIRSLEASNQALLESKSQISKELELAKATIRTFESQIEDMAKSDFLSDERNYYNRILGEKEANIRDERLDWMEKVKNLTEVLDSKDAQIERLNDRISGMDESRNAEKRKLTDEITRLQQQLADKDDEAKHLISMNRNLLIKIRNLELTSSASGHNSPTDHRSCSPHINTSEHHSPYRPSLASSSSDHNQRRELASECPLPGRVCLSQAEFNNIKASYEKWRIDTEKKLRDSFFTQIEDLKKKYLIERDSWNSALNKDVQLLATWIETLSVDSCLQDSAKDCKLLTPLRDLWLVIETKFDERRKALLDKKHEIEEAMKELEDAYNKSLEHDNSLNPTDIEEWREKLDEAQEEVEMLKAKYKRYKRLYAKLQETTKRERDELKKQFVQMLQEAKTKGDGLLSVNLPHFDK